jgi:hypothetical protein
MGVYKGCNVGAGFTNNLKHQKTISINPPLPDLVMIKKLTPEQEALIPVYREKWRKIAFSTEPFERKKTAELVQFAYANFGEQKPEVIFFYSPDAALKTISASQYTSKLGSELETGSRARGFFRANLIDGSTFATAEFIKQIKEII